MSNIRYEFFMSQIKHIHDINENDKTKISLVFYEGTQAACIFKICKNRDLTDVYGHLMKMRHPNLAVVYDCVYENGNTYVIEEYILGKTLADCLKEEGVFTEEKATKIISDVCDALEELHSFVPPIIHNDIKASNIMLCENGTAKLFDFDISRTYKEGASKNTKLMGTQEYAAPEHYGYGQSEPRTDIYSLGVALHELLTGEGLNHEHKVTYQGNLGKIIEKCVEIDPKNRYASVKILKEELKKCPKKTGVSLRIVIAGLCGVILLTMGGVFLANEKNNVKKPQQITGSESDSMVEDNSELLDTEQTECDTEIGLIDGTEENENSTEVESFEDGSNLLGNVSSSTQVGMGESNNDVVDGSESIEVDSDLSENVPNGTQGDMNESNSNSTDVPENSTPQKSVKVVHNIQDTFMAMDAWSDGTFLHIEEVSGNYYLYSSDGNSKQLNGVSAAYGAQLECNPYTNQMYLVLFDYNAMTVYSVDKKLDIEIVYKDEIGGKTGAFIAFYSDGSLVLDFLHLNSEDWSLIGTVASCPGPYIIQDTLYSFGFNMKGNKMLYQFLEYDENGNVVKDFPMEDEGIAFEDSMYRRPVYGNSKEVYFLGSKNGKYYAFRFDGVEYIPMVCLNDYGYAHFRYEELCVTDNAIRCYSNSHNAIIEFEIE